MPSHLAELKFKVSYSILKVHKNIPALTKHPPTPDSGWEAFNNTSKTTNIALPNKVSLDIYRHIHVAFNLNTTLVLLLPVAF